MKIILALALLSAPCAAKQPIDLLPKNFTVLDLKSLDGRTASGCALDQSDAVMFFRTGGEDFATSAKTFDSTYANTGHDIGMTLIALDAGNELCRVG